MCTVRREENRVHYTKFGPHLILTPREAKTVNNMNEKHIYLSEQTRLMDGFSLFGKEHFLYSFR
jgi:hypothetical protein